MTLNLSYPDAPPVDELRRDWAGIPWNPRAEWRWVAPRKWGVRDSAWARGPGHALLVDDAAHARLGDILRLVRSIDSAAYGWLRSEANGGEWTLDLPRRYVKFVVANMQEQRQ